MALASSKCVRDGLTSTIVALESDRTSEAYNVAARNEGTTQKVIRVLSHLLAAVLATSRYKAHSQLFTFVKGCPGHHRQYAVGADKIREKVAWVSQVKLDTGHRLSVN